MNTTLDPFIVGVSDDYGNPVPNVEVWFNVTRGTGAILAPSSPVVTDGQGQASVLMTLGTTSGDYVVKAEISIKGTASVIFNALALPGPLDHLSIDPEQVTVVVNQTESFSLTGYDEFGNEVVLSGVEWSTNAGSFASSDGSGAIFKARTNTTNNGYVNATSGDISASARVNVIADELFVIEVLPPEVWVTVGENQEFEASGYDKFQNQVPIAPSWSTDAGTMSGSEFRARKSPCKGWVNATFLNVTGTALVHVVPGALVEIEIHPPAADVSAGGTQSFTALGRDKYGNEVEMEPEWTTNVGSMNGSVLTANTTAQGGWVMATVGGVYNITQVSIVPGPVHHIVVTPSDVTLSMDESQSFTARGYDRYDNPVDIEPLWSSNVGTMIGNVLYVEETVGTGYVRAVVGNITGSAVVHVETESGVPRILGKIADLELEEDTPPYLWDLTKKAMDDTDAPKDLMWYLTEKDDTLYTVTGEYSSLLIITPKPDAFGDDRVILWVTDTDGHTASADLWINVTPINDKPIFFPKPPDLTITMDEPYTFNYTPYVSDVDNPRPELLLRASDNEHVTVRDHRLTYLYPADMLGQKVFVTLTVSDGIDNSSCVIQVNVTDDRVPVLEKELPDVTMYQGEVRYDVFDLDDYFYDPDGDAIYFSYGYTHISIVIKDNNSVDFYAESDWFGVEIVTFRARDPNYALIEDIISVTVIPVNDPPSIGGAPDLVVRYDVDYSFDLSPYIEDPDNTTAELTLTFEELGEEITVSPFIRVSPSNNLRMIINYPKEFWPSTFRVRITVSDGMDTAWQVINITVSDDWPPELIKPVPDVVFHEDTRLNDHFNVGDFFYDRDEHALYYTYGQVHTRVVIHDSGSVDFYAKKDWYGQEMITIRATDPDAALVEDIIMVTVLPVNDPPYIKSIKDIEGVQGETWVFELSPYIYDVDNELNELRIICESPYVTVAGTMLILEYPSDIGSDVIRVNVLDPDGEEANTTINITLREAEAPSGKEGYDIYDMIWYVVLVTLLIMIILAFYTYYSGRYLINELFLVYADTGILLAHRKKGEDSSKDKDLMTGMFTAIQDFVSDVFDGEEGEKGEGRGTHLKVMEIGDKKVMIERGQYTYLAAVFKGGTRRLGPKLHRTVAELEREFGSSLEDWKGNKKELKGIDEHISPLID